MNILSFQTHYDDVGWLYIELLVDGKSLGEVIGAKDSWIPCWLFEDDLPYAWKEKDPKLRIVTVCSCGESGCGHTECRVVEENGKVIFKDFDIDVTEEGKSKAFEFTQVNYQKVIKDIVTNVKAFMILQEKKKNHQVSR